MKMPMDKIKIHEDTPRFSITGSSLYTRRETKHIYYDLNHTLMMFILLTR